MQDVNDTFVEAERNRLPTACSATWSVLPTFSTTALPAPQAPQGRDDERPLQAPTSICPLLAYYYFLPSSTPPEATGRGGKVLTSATAER